MNLRLARQVLKHLRTRQATTLDPMMRMAAYVAEIAQKKEGR